MPIAELSGVARDTIAKINGVPIASISKINGVWLGADLTGFDSIIAASNSSAWWKSVATDECDGIADDVEIQASLTANKRVALAPGLFSLADWIYPAGGSALLGQGNSTIIHLSDDDAILIGTVSNVELGKFKLTGHAYEPCAIGITAAGSDISDFYLHDIWNSASLCNHFLVHPQTGRTISKLSFVRCIADSPDGFGYILGGEGTAPVVQDCTFYRCSALNVAIAETRVNVWSTGFSLAEFAAMTADRIHAIKCSVNQSWESDIHFENDPTKTNITLVDNSCSGAGKKGGATFGAGVLIAGPPASIVMDGSSGSDNAVADVRIWNGSTYDDYSFPHNFILGTGQSYSRISQGNCEGVLVTVDATHKRLVVYSSNDAPVSQQIELGAVYAADDGESYTFDGTKINADFTDYMVARLVAV